MQVTISTAPQPQKVHDDNSDHEPIRSIKCSSFSGERPPSRLSLCGCPGMGGWDWGGGVQGKESDFHQTLTGRLRIDSCANTSHSVQQCWRINTKYDFQRNKKKKRIIITRMCLLAKYVYIYTITFLLLHLIFFFPFCHNISPKYCLLVVQSMNLLAKMYSLGPLFFTLLQKCLVQKYGCVFIYLFHSSFWFYNKKKIK